MENWLLFGINVSKITKKELWEKINEYLSGKQQKYLVTINPEIILHAGKDEEYFYILNHSAINIPDGVGLKFAGWLSGKNLKIIPGADLVKDMLDFAQKKNKKVGIINWAHGLSNKNDIEKALKKKYPQLKFFVKDVENPSKTSLKDNSELNNFCPDILFVTFGAPEQEKFIFHNLKKIPSVKLAMGVGGSFDYLTAKAKRAPWIMRKIGLEWLWRLFGFLSGQKKGRKKRIYNAVIKFTIRFLKWRFILPWCYRPNVVCFLYKKVGDKYKIFIVRRSDWHTPHWQLPQGGIDKGEDIPTAGVRELREEAGTDKFRQVAFFKNLWRYKFNEELRKYKGQRHAGYRGQKQSLFIAEFTGKDEDIKINFWDHDKWQWIGEELLVEIVFPVRQKATQIYLDKFKEVIKNRQEN